MENAIKIVIHYSGSQETIYFNEVEVKQAIVLPQQETDLQLSQSKIPTIYYDGDEYHNITLNIWDLYQYGTRNKIEALRKAGCRMQVYPEFIESPALCYDVILTNPSIPRYKWAGYKQYRNYYQLKFAEVGLPEGAGIIEFEQ